MLRPGGKLAESVKAATAEASLIVRAALSLSGVALLVACVALVLVLRRAPAS